MDFGLISSAVSSLVAAKELGTAMIGVRDSNIVAGTVAQMNEQILKAQEALLTHSLQMGQLQQTHFEALEKLRTVEKLLADRGSYKLVELTTGSYVYRSIALQSADDGPQSTTEPTHHVCQACFDKNVKVVLQRKVFYGAVSLICSNCTTEYSTGEIVRD